MCLDFNLFILLDLENITNQFYWQVVRPTSGMEDIWEQGDDDDQPLDFNLCGWWRGHQRSISSSKN